MYIMFEYVPHTVAAQRRRIGTKLERLLGSTGGEACSCCESDLCVASPVSPQRRSSPGRKCTQALCLRPCHRSSWPPSVRSWRVLIAPRRLPWVRLQRPPATLAIICGSADACPAAGDVDNADARPVVCRCSPALAPPPPGQWRARRRGGCSRRPTAIHRPVGACRRASCARA